MCADYGVGCYHKTNYKVVLSSDEEIFGGWKNVTKLSDTVFPAQDMSINDRPHSLKVSIRPSPWLATIAQPHTTGQIRGSGGVASRGCTTKLN